MKKENSYKFLYAVSVILVLVFAARLMLDHSVCYKCDPGSFYIFIFKRMYEFLLPALISFAAGAVLKHKLKHR